MDKKFIASLVVLVILIGGIYYFAQTNNIRVANNDGAAGLSSGLNETNFNIQNMNVEILQQGTGQNAKAGDKVTVNYVGAFEDGVKFDSSIDRGQPFAFTLGEGSVIQGWDLGVVGMKQGEKRKLTIPPELAYGEYGAGGIIPPNATLIFEIDMLSIN